MTTVKLDKAEEGIKKLVTIGVKDMEADISDHEAQGDLDNMDKRDLVKLVINMAKNELRYTNYNFSEMNERKGHFKSALTDLQKSIDEKTKKAKKYQSFGNDPPQTIKALKQSIQQNNKEIESLKKNIDQFEHKKFNEQKAQNDAKELIDKKLVKKTYKFLEKDTHPHLVSVLEVYIAQLRARDKASREDVELYLRKYDGLLISMNRLDTRDIPGEFLQIYDRELEKNKGKFREGSENEDYEPFYSFAYFTNRLLELTVQEKELERQVKILEDDNRAKEKEIDEIETFIKEVDEVIDYQNQVDEEVKQFDILQEHYNLLNLRAKKIGKKSKFFEKYFFRQVKEKRKLKDNKLEKIDVMDDLDNVQDIDDRVEEMDYERAITKVEKDHKNDNPLGDNQLRAKTLKKQPTANKMQKSKAKSSGPANVEDVKVEMKEEKKTKATPKETTKGKEESVEDKSAESSEPESVDDQSNEDSSEGGDNQDANEESEEPSST